MSKVKQQALEIPINPVALKRLEGLAKNRKDISIEDLKAEYAEVREALVKKKKKGNLDIIAVAVVMANHREVKTFTRSSSTSKLGHFIGFKVGTQGCSDYVDRMKDWAESVIRRKGERVAEQDELIRYIDGKKIYLDTRQNIFGRPNEKQGTPLDPKLKLLRNGMYMIAKQADDEDFSLCLLRTSDNQLAVAWKQLPDLVPVSFPANIAEQGNATYMLWASTAKDSMTVFTKVNVDWEPYDVFVEFADKVVTPIKNVERYHKAVMSNKTRYIILRGTFGYLNFQRPIQWSGENVYMARLDDPERGYEPDYQVSLHIPDYVQCNAGLYSEAYVVGITENSWDTAEEPGPDGKPQRIMKDVWVKAYGVIGVKGLMVDDIEDIFDQEQQPITGFIE